MRVNHLREEKHKKKNDSQKKPHRQDRKTAVSD